MKGSYDKRGIITFPELERANSKFGYLEASTLGIENLHLHNPNFRITGGLSGVTESNGEITVAINGSWSGTNPENGFWWSFELPQFFGGAFSVGDGFGKRTARLMYEIKIPSILPIKDVAIYIGTTSNHGEMRSVDRQLLQGIRINAAGTAAQGITFRNSGGTWTSSLGISNSSGRGCTVEQILYGSSGLLVGQKYGPILKADNSTINEGFSANSAAGDTVIDFTTTGKVYGHIGILMMTSSTAFNLTFAARVYPVIISEYEST